ncbi:hypothetical protein ACHAW5_000911 [Stephanodiscus triporus]|uniref:Uncharacterized protein n=1 Tax=Stephanodiscus triporus TaxID=2934178 RepID=A0ABD3MVT7_9STRA
MTTAATTTTRDLLLHHHHHHLPVVITLGNPAVAAVMYAMIANVAYLARRAWIRNVHKRDIWRYCTLRAKADPWMR